MRAEASFRAKNNINNDNSGTRNRSGRHSRNRSSKRASASAGSSRKPGSCTGNESSKQRQQRQQQYKEHRRRELLEARSESLAGHVAALAMARRRAVAVREYVSLGRAGGGGGTAGGHVRSVEQAMARYLHCRYACVRLLTV